VFFNLGKGRKRGGRGGGFSYSFSLRGGKGGIPGDRSTRQAGEGAGKALDRWVGGKKKKKKRSPREIVLYDAKKKRRSSMKRMTPRDISQQRNGEKPSYGISHEEKERRGYNFSGGKKRKRKRACRCHFDSRGKESNFCRAPEG